VKLLITCPQDRPRPPPSRETDTINDIHLKVPNNTPCFIRRFNEHGIFDFRIKLSLETWDNVFENNDMNSMNNFFFEYILKSILFQFPPKKAGYKDES
jgi:hypothetical protein